MTSLHGVPITTALSHRNATNTKYRHESEVKDEGNTNQTLPPHEASIDEITPVTENNSHFALIDASEVLAKPDDLQHFELPEAELVRRVTFETVRERQGSLRTLSVGQRIARSWERHVSVKAPVEKRRDHLALERTFLGYLRTSLAFVMMGIVIAQLFRLYELPISEIEMPYYNASIPLSTACTAVGMIILLLGACRFYRSQAAMMRGKCLAGGWEVYTVMALSISMTVVLLSFIASFKDYDDD